MSHILSEVILVLFTPSHIHEGLPNIVSLAGRTEPYGYGTPQKARKLRSTKVTDMKF